MVNRQTLYFGLVLSFSVCTGVTLYILYRHRRKRSPSNANQVIGRLSNLSRLNTLDDNIYDELSTPSDIDTDESDTNQYLNELHIPNGLVPLTPDQASILTEFLYRSNHDETLLHTVLISITNASAFRESQINLAKAGCINRLGELLLKEENGKIKCQILLALHNLALNDFAITQFSNIVSNVIDLCRKNATNSLIRIYSLNLLINMSVLEYLHEEYMICIDELSLLVQSTYSIDDEALSAVKILVNLSNNKSNIEYLLNLTGIEIKTVMNTYTTRIEHSSKSEDILNRYLIFYCNVADMIQNELKLLEDNNNNNNNNNGANHIGWLTNENSHRHGALYYEYFDDEKYILAKSFLRLQYTSSTINALMKRLYQLMKLVHDTIIRLSNYDKSRYRLNDQR